MPGPGDYFLSLLIGVVFGAGAIGQLATDTADGFTIGAAVAAVAFLALSFGPKARR